MSVGDHVSKDIQRLLQSQDLGTVTPAAFRQVGSAVFPDSSTMADLAGFVQIVDAFRATHSTAYGSPIPATAASTAALVDSGDLLTLTGNQVAMVQAVNVQNVSVTDAATAQVTLNGVPLAETLTVPATSSSIFVFQYPIYVDSNAPLKIVASSSDITTTATYILTSI